MIRNEFAYRKYNLEIINYLTMLRAPKDIRLKACVAERNTTSILHLRS